MKKSVCLLVVLLCLSVFASAQSNGTGPYAFASFDTPGFDSVNLGNLNTRFTIPIVSRTGRGTPFQYALQYEGLVWSTSSAGGGGTWLPDSSWGFVGALNGTAFSGYLTWVEKQRRCGKVEQGDENQPAIDKTAFLYHDPYGALHSFNYQIRGGCPITGQSDVVIGDGSSNDGSGYTVFGLASFKIRSRSGTTITPALSATGQNATDITDPNGNRISASGSGIFTDTLGVTALTISGSSPRTFTYPVTAQANSQTTATATLSYRTYTVRTNFGCAGVSEYGSNTVALPDKLTLADNSFYAFTYEPTYQASDGAVTGRLASVTLPTGGTISYAYTGGCSGAGINADGTVGSLTRTTSDGTRTYTRAPINGNATSTVLQDEKGNQTYYAFTIDSGTHQFYKTHQQTYQGATSGGALLLDEYTCYNGSNANCDGVALTLPITQSSVITSYNGGSQSTTTSTFTASGLMTAQSSNGVQTSWSYNDFGEVLTSTTTFNGTTIASSSNGYDESSLTTSSGVPQHTSVSGARGNLTSTHVATGSSTLSTSTTYYDTGVPNTSMAVDGGQTTYSYDATQGFVTGTSLPTPSSGVALSTSASYDATSAALLSSTGLNAGETTTVNEYDLLMRPNKVTLPSGSVVTYGRGSPTNMTVQQTIDSGRKSTTMVQLDAYGRQERVAVANGQAGSNTWYQTDYCYDGTGLLSFQSLQYQGSGFGVPKHCLSPGTAYEYDALGRITKVTTSDGTSATKYQNRAVLTTDVNNVSRITQYDSLGRVTGVCEIWSMPRTGESPTDCGMDISGSGYLTSYSYDLPNHTTTITQGFQQRSFQTDQAGRTVFTSEPERGVTTYGYAYNGTGLVVTRTRPQENQTSGNATTATTYQYDLLSRMVSTSYSSSNRVKQFGYDGQTDGNGVSLGSTKGRMTTAFSMVNSVLMAGTWFSYDIAGRVTRTLQCYPDGCGNGAFDILQYYDHDLAGNQIQSSFLTSGSSGTRVDTNTHYTVASEVDGITNSLTGASNNNGIVISNVTLTPFGPQSFAYGNGFTAWRDYDSVGRNTGRYTCSGSPSSQCLQNNAQLYAKEVSTFKGSQVTSREDSTLGGHGTFTYDEFNRLASATYPQLNLAFTYGYDRYGNRLEQRATQGSGPQPLFSVNAATNRITGFSYDLAGNLLNDGMHSYQYDPDGNVTSVDGQTAIYYMDALNHRVQVDLDGTSQAYAFNPDGQRSSIWNAASSGTASVISANTYWNGRSIAYWMSPNVSTGQTTIAIKFTNDAANGSEDRNLYLDTLYVNGTQISPSDPRVDYSHSCSNGGTIACNGYATITVPQLTVLTIGAHGTPLQGVYPRMQVLLNGVEAGEWDTTSNEQYYIVNPSTAPGSIHYQEQDAVGSERYRFIPSGGVEAAYNTLPFGDKLQQYGTDDDPSHFASLDHDVSSDTYHAQFRQYSAAQGRWMSPDPYDGSYNPSDPQSLNRYTYVLNNPLAFLDWLGLDDWDPATNTLHTDGGDGTGIVYDNYGNRPGCYNPVNASMCVAPGSLPAGSAPSKPTPTPKPAPAPAPKTVTKLTAAQCKAAQTLLDREAKFGTAATARMSGNTFDRGDRTIEPFNSSSVPNLHLPNGEELDLDWFTDLTATHWVLYPAAKLYWTALRKGHMPIGNALPFSDPGERTAFMDSVGGTRYSDIFTPEMMKSCH